eukprot:c3638_g1_i1 orf=131-994(+)
MHGVVHYGVCHYGGLSRQDFMDHLPSSSSLHLPRMLQMNVSVGTKQAKIRARKERQLELAAVFHDRAVDVEKHATIKTPMVKICGVTNVNDAVLAAQAGARFVGMILWPKSKRSISIDTAKEIAHAVRLHNAEPVGVFVDEDAETIEKCCNAANIGIAQLHGEGARLSLTKLPCHLVTIYVLNVDKSGIVQTPLPEANQVDWILLDSLQGGSGCSFDWEKLKDLSVKSRRGWLLAGGLKPENVATAISILKPDLVDVSSGVTMEDGLHKDPTRVSSFMSAVKSCTFK